RHRRTGEAHRRGAAEAGLQVAVPAQLRGGADQPRALSPREEGRRRAADADRRGAHAHGGGGEEVRSRFGAQRRCGARRRRGGCGGVTTAALVCWKCGASLAALPLPLSRLAECPADRAELHVCRLCRFFDARTARQCSEIRAEEVIDKERANYCDWFKPRPGAYDARTREKAVSARALL